MKTDGWPRSVAILRKCQRCWKWRSVDQFVELDHMCQPCMRTSEKVVGHHGLVRGLVITEKGRAALREARKAAVA